VALGTVIAVSMIFLIVALTLATLTVLDLALASSYSDGAQGELMARAAVAQFIHEQSAIPRSILSPANHPNLLARYQQPVFPDGAPHLPGTVSITFDASQPYYSTDNSASSNSAAGWMDRGTETQSVPPLSVDLLMTVVCGGRMSHFEAIVGQRWPYALTSSHLVLSDFGSMPAAVQGPTYVPSAPIPIMPAPPGVPSMGYGDGTPIQLDRVDSGTFYHTEQAVAGVSTVTVNEAVGNPLPLDRLDFNASSAAVTPPGAAEQERFQIALNTTGLLVHQGLPPGITPPSLQSRQDEQGNKQYVLTQSLALGDSPPADPNTNPSPAALPVSGSTFVVNGSLVNHYYIPAQCGNPSVPDTVGGSNSGLFLNNCSLYINGDLDLSYQGPSASCACVSSGSPQPYPIVLWGNNATLVVAGSIIVSQGAIDSSGEKAMVIYCQRLLMSATGKIQGLVVAEDSAVFTSVGTSPGLTILGGVLVGGRQMQLDVEGLPDAAYSFTGTALSSTVIQYDPHYLDALHGCALPSLTLLRKIP
jgi:hypothetical protein